MDPQTSFLTAADVKGWYVSLRMSCSQRTEWFRQISGCGARPTLLEYADGADCFEMTVSNRAAKAALDMGLFIKSVIQAVAVVNCGELHITIGSVRLCYSCSYLLVH